MFFPKISIEIRNSVSVHNDRILMSRSKLEIEEILEENLLNLRRVKWKNSLEFFVIYLIALSLDFYNYSMYMF